ncbi:Signal transduction histidine kinase [Pseudobacteriovorax antillogorgiicola]|uniref:histidine kinase n=2 Tax=Pseudobacteriovorax antillogorgiicola TaxID=1513793 RepID=A0A1Y6BXI5_9BACT|nr:signal transduction histidine kinase [Pseudobacteriovorax antillogorgiicola]SMF30318.1 Signal transduction histidine kinase [Pseudobacteriovorax antillogorgiicola]
MLALALFLASKSLAMSDLVVSEYRYFTESDRSLSLHDYLDKIRRNEAKNAEFLVFGYHSKPMWFSFKVYNPTSETLRYNWVGASSVFSQLDVWIVRSSLKHNYFQSGTHRPINQQAVPSRTIAFPLLVKANEVVTVVLKAYSPVSINFSYSLISQDNWSHYQVKDAAFYIMIIAMMVAIVFYNLFLTASLRSRTYLFYCLFGISMTLHISVTSGFWFLIDGDLRAILLDSNPYIRCFVPASALLFARQFLQTEKYMPVSDLILRIMIYLWIPPFICLLFGESSTAGLLTDIFNSLASLTALLVSIKACIKGLKGAVLYLCAWGTIIFTVIYWTLAMYSIIPQSAISRNAIYVGCVIEVFLMSLALAVKIKELQFEKASLSEKAKHGDKMQQLARVLCHDLATPISVIDGAIRILPKVAANDQPRWIKRIERANQKLEQITQHVRSMLALESGKKIISLEAVPIRSLIDDAQFLFSEQLQKKKLQLVVEMEADELHVLAHPISLGNDVINNLVSNAIKFSFPDSKIIIKVTEPNKDQIIITVQDFGVGMPAEIRDEIFDSSSNTSRPGTDGEQGTGFGMPIVKAYVEAFGGSIEVNSQEAHQSDHHGTIFVVYLHKAYIDTNAVLATAN